MASIATPSLVTLTLAVLGGACKVGEGPEIPDEQTGIHVCASPVPATGGTALTFYRFGHVPCASKTPVDSIAIHGVNADGLVYGRLASLMGPEERGGFVSVDLPGHGRSEVPELDRLAEVNPTLLADEIVDLIDYLAPDDGRSRTLVCHSMAGAVCLRLLERARSSTLAAVLVNPTLPVEGGEVQLIGSVRWAPQWLRLDIAADVIQGIPFAEDKAGVASNQIDLVALQREKIRQTNYRLSGRVDGELHDLGTPISRRREMFDEAERRRLSRALNNALRRQGRLDAWVDEDMDERIETVGPRVCVLLDPGDDVVDGDATLARVERLDVGIGVHVLATMQGDHSSINTIPELVLGRLRLSDPCAS